MRTGDDTFLSIVSGSSRRHVAVCAADGTCRWSGLGNQFLSHIRETDAIVNVVRCFEDENVVHVAGRVSPLDDIEVIQTELALADLSTVEETIAREQKKARSGVKDSAKLVALLETLVPHLNEAKPVRTLGLGAAEMALIKPLCLVTAKPSSRPLRPQIEHLS